MSEREYTHPCPRCGRMRRCVGVRTEAKKTGGTRDVHEINCTRKCAGLHEPDTKDRDHCKGAKIRVYGRGK